MNTNKASTIEISGGCLSMIDKAITLAASSARVKALPVVQQTKVADAAGNISQLAMAFQVQENLLLNANDQPVLVVTHKNTCKAINQHLAAITQPDLKTPSAILRAELMDLVGANEGDFRSKILSGARIRKAVNEVAKELQMKPYAACSDELKAMVDDGLVIMKGANCYLAK